MENNGRSTERITSCASEKSGQRDPRRDFAGNESGRREDCALLSSVGALLTPVLHGHGLTVAVGDGGRGLRSRRRRGQTQRDQQREQKGKHGSQSPLV